MSAAARIGQYAICIMPAAAGRSPSAVARSVSLRRSLDVVARYEYKLASRTVGSCDVPLLARNSFVSTGRVYCVGTNAYFQRISLEYFAILGMWHSLLQIV